MTKMIEELQINAKQLEVMQGMGYAIVAIQEKMDKLAKNIRIIETATQEIKHPTSEL